MEQIDIDNLTLDKIPTTESDFCEFKSSKVKTDIDGLKNKLGKAVSGFSNSGGGYFIVGIDEKTGNADGGIPLVIGRRPLVDWVDTMIHQLVEPAPLYKTKLIEDPAGRGTIEKGNAVLVVYIYESFSGPHMMDGVYYIRAGVHTIKSRNFIVEAIRSKRFRSNPKLTYLFRLNPSHDEVLQLGIVALSDAPAINIRIYLDPLPEAMDELEDAFPVQIAVIDRNNPFFFDVAFYAGSDVSFGDNVKLKLKYEDVYSNKYVQEYTIGVTQSAPPMKFGTNSTKKLVEILEKIDKSISKIGPPPKPVNKPASITLPSTRNIFEYLEKYIPELLMEMQKDILREPFVREFILISKNYRYNHNPNKDIFMYYYEDHTYLRNKVRILENCNLIYEITFNTTDRFIMGEQLVEYLINKKPSDKLE